MRWQLENHAVKTAAPGAEVWEIEGLGPVPGAAAYRVTLASDTDTTRLLYYRNRILHNYSWLLNGRIVAIIRPSANSRSQELVFGQHLSLVQAQTYLSLVRSFGLSPAGRHPAIEPEA